jgi:phosphoglycerol transferase MdoB-like AlkP superfamily enzyme
MVSMLRRFKTIRLGQWCHRHASLVLAGLGPALGASVYFDLFSYPIIGSFYRPELIFEFGIVLYFSLIMAIFQRRKLVGAFLTSLAFLSFYTIVFGKYLILHEPVSLFDLRLLDELIFVIPYGYLAPISVLAVGCGYLFIKNLQWPKPAWMWLWLAPFLGFALCANLFPNVTIRVMDRLQPRNVSRTDREMFKTGPLFALSREVPMFVRMRRFLDTPPDSLTVSENRVGVRLEFASSRGLKQKRNVHVIVLESFIDPLNFANARFPFDPIDSRFRRWMNEAPSLALSPRFGGGSAAVEFEILCGLPAYDMFGLEFSHLGGARMPCLPEILRGDGYTAVGSVPVSPTFFNCGRAYASVGFERGYFLEDFALTDMDGDWLANAEVFRQVLQFVEPELKNRRPLFNYVVTGSGHAPFHLNFKTRPAVFPGESLVESVANAVHYNSAAVADFVTTLEQRDPKAIIVVVGDHLPVLYRQGDGYKNGDYRLPYNKRAQPGFWQRNRLFAIESRATTLVVRKDRKSVPVGLIPHFSILEVILDLLHDGAYCQAHDCESRRRIIYRPFGSDPIFTTSGDFPERVCMAKHAETDADCQAAERHHRAMLEEYKTLVRQGVQPSVSAVASLRAQRP